MRRPWPSTLNFARARDTLRPLPREPANDVRDARLEALSKDDLSSELALKRAEERIAKAKGPELARGARWMLRRLRLRLSRAGRI